MDVSTADLAWTTSTILSIVALIISYLAYRHATRGPDIELIAEDQEATYTETLRDGYNEANFIFSVIFQNKGAKGGGAVGIKPHITNLRKMKELIKENGGTLTHFYDFKDEAGKRVDPRFFLASIPGHTAVPVNIEFSLQHHHAHYISGISIELSNAQRKKFESKKPISFKELFNQMENKFEIKIGFKKTTSKYKLDQVEESLTLTLSPKER